jgi:hypothetical protein
MEGKGPSGSEVARLLKHIRDEYESAKNGLTGLAYGMSQHKFITQKMENIGKWHEELRGLVGDTAMALVAEQLDALPESNIPSV